MADFKNTRALYEHHVEAAQKLDMAAAKYCREHGLDVHKFSYYKTQKPKSKRQFLPVKIEALATTSSLKSKNIDPEWLAQFIHNLLSR